MSELPNASKNTMAGMICGSGYIGIIHQLQDEMNKMERELDRNRAEIDRLKEDLANAKDEGFSSATLPTKEAEEKLLKRISDLVWLVRNLSDALDCVYGKLPSHWRELPFSYHELKRKVKEVMKNG